MTRVILVTFGFLGWAWFEVSGGTAFEPGTNGVRVLAKVERPVTVSEERVAAAEPEALQAEPVVTRTSGMGSSLAGVTNVVAGMGLAQVEPEANKVAALITTNLRNDVSPEPVRLVAAIIDYRAVTGNRVNLRSGPSTSYDVVTQLLRGDEVEILQQGDEGWLKLRTLSGSDIGWMSGKFLASID